MFFRFFKEHNLFFISQKLPQIYRGCLRTLSKLSKMFFMAIFADLLCRVLAVNLHIFNEIEEAFEINS